MTLRTILLSEILVNPEWHSRVHVSEAFVKTIDVARPKALLVAQVHDEFRLVDGFHTLAALRAAGVTEAVCEVFPSNYTDFWTAVIEANKDEHRSLADKRKVVRIGTKLGLSVPVIALTAGLRESFVQNVLSAGTTYTAVAPQQSAEDEFEAACRRAAKLFRSEIERLVTLHGRMRRESAHPVCAQFSTAVRNQLKRLAAETGLNQTTEKTLFDTRFPQHLDTDEFRELWSDFVADRKRRKLSTIDNVQKRQIGILSHFDAEQATQIVLKAIEGSWKGIPVFSDLSSTMWAGRPPAYPPKGFRQSPPSSAAPPCRNGARAQDRSRHGSLFAVAGAGSASFDEERASFLNSR